MKQAIVSVRMARISFGALPCGGGGLDDSSRLDVVEIATCYRACLLPGRAKDLSAPRYNVQLSSEMTN